MQGLGATFTLTPNKTNAEVVISGLINNNTNTTTANGIRYELFWGTGTAPSNGGSLASNCGTTSCTQLTAQVNATASPAPGTNVWQIPFSISANITGLTPGVAIWWDLAAESASGTGYSFKQVVGSGRDF